MAAAFVSGVDGNGETLSVTVAAGTNCLVVHTCTSDPTDTVTGIAYGGVALTRLNGGSKPTNTGYVDTWYLKNPAVGTANVVVTWSGSVTAAIVSASMYSGIGEVSAGFTNTDTGTSVTTDCGVSARAGIVECACSTYDADATKHANQTANQSQTNGSTRLFSSYKAIARQEAVTVNYTTAGNEEKRLNAVMLYQVGGQVI